MDELKVEIRLEELSVSNPLDPDSVKVNHIAIEDMSELQKHIPVGAYYLADVFVCQDGFVVRIPLDAMNLGEYMLYTKIINITIHKGDG
jgi:hypothetical protein